MLLRSLLALLFLSNGYPLHPAPHYWDKQGLVKPLHHPLDRDHIRAHYRGKVPYVRSPYDFYQTRPWVDRRNWWCRRHLYY